MFLIVHCKTLHQEQFVTNNQIDDPPRQTTTWATHLARVTCLLR